MKFKIDELDVYFPFDTVFKEQYEYMKALKKTFENQGHGILEMPTGTGKTVSLLALIMSYLQAYPDKYKKLVYCTRTVVEMEKTLEEVKMVIKSKKEDDPKSEFKFLAAGLSARKNLCINKEVKQLENGEKVDAECRKRTAQWVRLNNAKKSEDEEKMECEYFECFQDTEEELKFEEGVYNLDDIRDMGDKQTLCPYYLARKLVGQSNVVVYNYLYMLDPDIKDLVPAELQSSTIVVFDEAHNIDNICLEAFSVKINKALLSTANQNISKIEGKIGNVETQNQQKMETEYNQLIKGLQERGKITEEQANQNQNQIPEDLKQEAIPFTIRKSKPFINHLKKIVIFLQNKLKEKSDAIIDPPLFLNDMTISNKTDQKALQFTEERLSMLMNTLEITESDEYRAIKQISHFATLLATYAKGFKVIFQPNPRDGALNDPFLNFSCLDSSFAMKPIFEQYKSVILTSGTMSPLEMLPKILNFKPVVCESIDIELSANNIQPIMVTKGMDFSELSSEYISRNNPEITRSYGMLLIELSQIIPDGIVVFFPSYMYMEKVIQEWNDDKILTELQKHKLLFFESKDVQQTSTSLGNFRKGCDSGRGAVFFSIARGKVAEGIDFNQHYGRCVLMIGFPVQNSNDPILIERCKFLTENYEITKNDYIEFDAMRQAAQCLGRVIRGKKDYGLMIMAEKRFARSRVKNKLPKWIKKQMKDVHCDIPIDLALTVTRLFFKDMGNDFELDEKSYFTKQKFEQMEKDLLQEAKMNIEEDANEDKQHIQPNNEQILNNTNLEEDNGDENKINNNNIHQNDRNNNIQQKDDDSNNIQQGQQQQNDNDDSKQKQDIQYNQNGVRIYDDDEDLF